MVLPVKSQIRVYPNVDSLMPAVAESLVERIQSVVSLGNCFSLVLSGGNTPRSLYRLLATEFKDRITWEQMQLFWSDERYVPHSDTRSNYRMAEEILFRHVPIPRQNIHPMPTELPDPQQGAQAYEGVLRTYFPPPWPRFELVLLGLGPEGHTASLFPNSPALEENERWVVSVKAAADPPVRLTLSMPAINHAREVYFLATGADKAPAVERALTWTPGKPASPAAMVRPEDGNTVWWIDESAAAYLPESYRL